jgi:hypothetical protein
MDAELERKLREELDRAEIWRVTQRLARGLDRIDSELARTCYWDDAIDDHSHFVGGPDGFLQYAEAMARGFKTTQHTLSNHTCELDGDDAWCETYYLFVGVGTQPPHFMSSGRYVDHFRRRDGAWRILNRVTLVEGQFDLPAGTLGADLPSPYGPGEKYPGTRDRDDVSYARPLVPRQPKG